MISATQEALMRRRALRGRVAHPLHERLLADLKGAPLPVREAHAAAERAVEARIELAGKVREAQEAEQLAPAADRQAIKAALSAGKQAPKATEEAAKAKVVELGRHYDAAREHEEETLAQLAETCAVHGGEWEAARTESLSEKSARAVELIDAALASWQELDAEFSIVTWLHRLDPSKPRTLSPVGVGLRTDDLDPEQMFRMLGGLATRATELATEGETGRDWRSRTRAEHRRQVDEAVEAARAATA